MKRHHVLMTIALWFSVLAMGGWAAEWRMAEGPLATDWARQVTPDNAWPEYPRPQLVRDNWVNLNGLWQYAIRPQDEGTPDAWDGQILVPFAVQSALSGVMKPVTPEEKLWYRRSFKAPAIPRDGRLLLHFGAVDWKCTVWVNGREVGQHVGGYDPFTFDITNALVAGENELVVSVWDPTNTGYQPRGKQVLKPRGIMYTAVTGIWQTAWLEPVPGSYVKSLKIVPDVDRELVQVTVDAPRGTSVRLEAVDGNQTVSQGEGAAGQPIELHVKDAKLWSPDTPHLYDLRVALVAQGQTTDTVRSYFGMRKIEVRKDDQGINRLVLNNRVLFQFGPLDQGWWPDGLYTAPSDEALKYDIRMTKSFGMNMARKHVKYEPARWYYWCDKLGLMVWQDMPSGDAPRNDESKANYRRELKAMIDALHHFPSIVMWVPFNEGWGQHDTPEIVGWIKQYDPTRLVNEASGWADKGSGDVSDVHKYPGPGMRPLEDKRAVVLGEFGGLGMPVPGHTWLAEKSWGYVSFKSSSDLTEAYVDRLTRLRPLIGKGLSAAVYTQTSDVEIEVNGLMTYDRKVVKMDLDRISAAAHKLYLPPPLVRTLVPTSEQHAQQWRYTLKQPDKNWALGDFDDSQWQSGHGGFGTKGTPGAVVGTVWDSPDIWLRRTINLDALPINGQISLTVHHDEDAEVYINGRLVKRLRGYSTSYHSVALEAGGVKALQVGRNTLAIHCHQTTGGQFIDAGLSVIVERE